MRKQHSTFALIGASGSSFYYLQSRYYDPEQGRFLNADSYASTGQGILGNNMFAYCNNNPVNGCDPCGNCFHRWDFWNDCEICGGEKLRDNIIKSIASIKESLQKTVETEIKSNANVLEMLVSVSKSNTYKSLHGMYQVASGLGKMADGIMLVAAPVPTPLDDLSGLVLLGQGGLTIHNGLVKLMEVGIYEMAP